MNPVLLGWVKLVCSTVGFGMAIAACSSSQNDVATRSRSNDGVSEEDAPATLDAFYEEYVEVTCRTATECYGFPSLYCRSDVWFEDYYGPKAADLVYHRDVAAQCLAAVRDWECGDMDFAAADACQRFAEGPGKENDSCTGTIDCGLDFYCDDDEQCPGVCLPRASDGEDCTVSPCVQGLTCSGDRCTVPAGEGADCSDLDCKDGLSCIEDVCKPYRPFSRQLGESCNDSADCYGLEHCDLETKTCVPAGREGDACGVVPCYLDFYCADSVCRARKPNGEPCAERPECTSGACIDGQCQELREIGEECTGPLDCRTVGCSEDGKCLPLGSCQ